MESLLKKFAFNNKLKFNINEDKVNFLVFFL
jgi:hypothetical protein